jgi:hypothetical protein
MQIEDSAALERAVTDDCTDLEKRDVRALTEYMTVLPFGGEVYSVTTESGSEYRVDALGKRCSCPDYKNNLPTDGGRERCKHIARVAFATGERAIPRWTNPDAIDSQLGEHTDTDVHQDTSPAALSLPATDGVTTEANKIQTDGGTATVADDSTCENGDDHCDGPNSEALPCFACFKLDQ